MLNDLFKKEWRNVLASGRVLSITESSMMIALESGLSFEKCKKNLVKFLLNEERALFLNENQVIDICVLGDKSIQSIRHLYEILKREYVISGVNADPETAIIADEVKRENHALNNALQNKITEINSLYNTWQRFRGDGQREKVQRKGIYLYLKEKGTPQRLRDIYLNACFLPIFFSHNETRHALASSECFQQLLWDYWSCKPTSAEDAICIHQWLWSRKNICGEQEIITDLLGNYLRKVKTFTVDELVFGLGILGFRIDRVILEHILMYAFNCHRISSTLWTTNKDDPHYFIPNLQVVWQRTILLWKQNLSGKEKYILDHRILGGQTLNEVGSMLDISRERVRQIETKLYNNLSHVKRMAYLKPYITWIWESLQTEKIISLRVLGVLPGDYKLFDRLTSKFVKLKNNIIRVYQDIVILRSAFRDFAERASEMAEANDCFIDSYELATKLGLQEKAAECKKILKEVYGLLQVEEGIFYCNALLSAENPQKRSLKLDDQFFMILYYARRPLHYREIREVAEMLGLPFSFKLENERNVLSAILRSTRIKRIAPGIYGLKSWKISGHIRLNDLVYAVLNESNRPLTFEEIYQEVQKRRHDEVSRSSVYVYVNTHPCIMYTTARKYIPADWGADYNKLKKFELTPQDIVRNGSLRPGKVILGVFQFQGRYIIKYRLSESYWRANKIRISRDVKLKFGSKILVISAGGELYLESISNELISGLGDWGDGLGVGTIFYLEFFNDHLVRPLSEKQFESYRHLPDMLLKKAEDLWSAKFRFPASLSKFVDKC